MHYQRVKVDTAGQGHSAVYSYFLNSSLPLTQSGTTVTWKGSWYIIGTLQMR